MKCKDLSSSVTIDGKLYKTTNGFNDKLYVYYPKEKNQPHLTVEAEGGKAEFKKFHISITVLNDKNPKVDKSFHLYFEGERYTGTNYNSQQFKDYSEGWKKVTDNLSKYQGMGRSFWQEMNK